MESPESRSFRPSSPPMAGRYLRTRRWRDIRSCDIELAQRLICDHGPRIHLRIASAGRRQGLDAAAAAWAQ